MRKYLVTHTSGGHRFTNAFIIANHYNHALSSFAEMAKEMRKTFPNAKDGAVDCTSVKASNWCKGCPIIRYLVPDEFVGLPTCDDGWMVCDKLPDVVW